MDTPATSGWGTMEARGGTILCGQRSMADGVDLFYRCWRQDVPDLVMVIHGLGGHSGWYIGVGNLLATRGLSVFVPDLRGFGRSGGSRGHILRARVLIDDLEAMADQAIQATGAVRWHLIGHSMGAVLAVHLAARYADTPGRTGRDSQPLRRLSPASVSLVNPWVEDTNGVPPAVVLRVAAGGLMGSARLWALAGGVERMVDHPAAHEYLRGDPHRVQEESASFLTQILVYRMALPRVAGRVKAPTQVIQTGGDIVVHHNASRKLFERLGCTEKEWAAPSAGGHDFELDADHSEVDNLLAAWCLRHQ